MEKKEAVKIENIHVGSPTFPQHVQECYLGRYEADRGPSLGFMELLGLQDHFSPSLFDMLQVQVPSSVVQPVAAAAAPPPRPSPVNIVTKMEPSLELFNQPATPNSSSISSESTGALNDEVLVKAVDDEEEEQQKTKKELNPKKTNQKRQREPRFAFMTKSEVDHLEDGYRWRKYGQKAVKNSPFPRSYYRCTTASCNVKKRVERSFSDPSIVVTTYEGQHTHPSPVMPRPSFAAVASENGFLSTGLTLPMQRRNSLYEQHQQHVVSNLSPLGFIYNGTPNVCFRNERSFCSTTGSALLRDHGLLQDIVPSHMLKEE